MSTLSDKLKSKYKKDVDEHRRLELEATHRLWHKRMMVYVPFYASQTPEQTRMYGNCYNTGMTKQERDNLHNEMVKMWMAPIRQISLYSQGIPIAYPNKMQAIDVYQDIKLHVGNWQEILGQSMNRRSMAPPMEDFELMLEFAENLEVYLEHYYYHLKDKSFTPFKQHTMNRFINSDRYMHRDDSTYSKLRTGIYSYQLDRKPRKDDIRQSTMNTGNRDFYQTMPEFTDIDADAANAFIRGGQ